MAGLEARQAPADLAGFVRRHDPDRFLAALFAPPARRKALFALYAFNHELARAREAAAQPTLALIRLAWWREVVAGEARQHEVATPLRAAIAAGSLDAGDLARLIAAREIEAAPAIPTLACWRAYVMESAGGLAAAAGRALGADAAARDRLRQLGAAYGAGGILRSISAQAGLGRCLLPEDLLAETGLGPAAVIADPASPRLAPVRRALAAEGAAWLAAGDFLSLPGRWRAAALPAVFARRDLAVAARGASAVPGPRGLGARLAVVWAGLTRPGRGAGRPGESG